MPWEAILVIISIITAVFAFAASTGTIVWFVSNQFSISTEKMHSAVNDLSKAIVSKLEYHEKHDDERFAEIGKTVDNRVKEVSDRIWNIELRNAAKDGTLPIEYPIRKKQT